MCDVVCCGVIVADVLVQGVDESVFKRDITRVPLIKLRPGGDSLNQALLLSTMGYKVALCGKTGNDEIGAFLLTEITNNGIDSRFIKQDPDVPTSTTIVMIKPDSQRHFIGCSKASNSTLKLEDIDTSSFIGAKVVSIGSIYASTSFTGDICKEVLSKAKEYHCITVADMMHAERHTIEDLEQCLPYIDYFIPSYDEASCITKLTDLDEIASRLLSLGTKCVILKLGAKGCYLCNAEIRKTIPSFPADAIDTTGAGDAMVAAFISGILDKKDLVDCVKYGCAAGSLTVRFVGANGGIKTKKDIDILAET